MGGEEKIINGLKLNLPDYIIIQPASCILYGKPFFGIDYGQNIRNFIEKHYDIEELFQDTSKEIPQDEKFFMAIYKRK